MSHGRILAILKRCGDAIPRFERAVALAPQAMDYRKQLAQCQADVGQHELALRTVDAALALDPAYAELHLTRADNLRDLGRNDEAVAAYRKFLELDKQNSVMRPVAEKFIELLSG